MTASTRATSPSAASPSCSARPTRADADDRTSLQTPLAAASCSSASSRSARTCRRAACCRRSSSTGRTSSICRGSTSSWSRSPARSRSRSALPLGIALTRPAIRPYADAITQFVNLGTTIPTLAILALAMSVLGIGAPPAIFGLVMLTLLPIVLQHHRRPAHGAGAPDRGRARHGHDRRADPVPGRVAERRCS